MSKNQPKKQHYYPRMFLQGFCNQEDNIYFLDAEKNKIEPRNRESVARQKHLYTVADKQDIKNRYVVEKRFAEIEAHVTPLFERIRIKKFEEISETQINQIIDFIVLLFIRTPHTVKTAENVISKQSVLSEIRSNYSIQPDYSIRAERFIEKLSTQKGLTYAMTLSGSFELRHQRITENFDGFLLTLAPEAPSLMLNDRYTCWEMLSPDIPYVGRDVDWATIEVKMHFPVSSRCCVSFVPKSDQARKGTSKMLFHTRTLSKNDAIIINKLSYGQMERYAFCEDQKVLEELRNGQ